MASKFLKTFSFVLYGIVTFLLLCAVLVLIFKEDKTCSTGPTVDLAKLLNDTSDSSPSSSSSSSSSSPSSSSSSSSSSEMAPSVVMPAAAAAAPTTPPPRFEGNFELYSSENFDEFLSELGIGYFTRLAATKASSRYVISSSVDERDRATTYYTLKTISTFGTSAITFTNGVQFEEDRLDGNRVQSVMTIKGNKWIQRQFGDGLNEVTIVREFSEAEVVVTSVVNDVVCVRKYKRTSR